LIFDVLVVDKDGGHATEFVFVQLIIHS
jgi:hypothetical protein